MNDDEVVDRFEKQLHAQLQESVERVEQDTADELYQRRMAALQQAANATSETTSEERKGWAAFGLVPAGVTAAAAIAMVTWLSQSDIEDAVNEAPTVAISDQGLSAPIVNQEPAETLTETIEALTETIESEAVWDESFEMLDEMEFYAWLAEQEYAG